MKAVYKSKMEAMRDIAIENRKPSNKMRGKYVLRLAPKYLIDKYKMKLYSPVFKTSKAYIKKINSWFIYHPFSKFLNVFKAVFYWSQKFKLLWISV